MLPILNRDAEAGARPWDWVDWSRWNQTIRDHFVYKNLSNHLATTCLYPYFEFQWPLRDRTDIFVANGGYGGAWETSNGLSLLVIVYVVVMCSGAASSALALIANGPRVSADWRDVKLVPKVLSGLDKLFPKSEHRAILETCT